LHLRVLAIVGIFLAPWLTGCDNAAPTDAQLVDLFTNQRDVFEQLRKAICSDAPHIVWSGTGPTDRPHSNEPKLPPEKLAFFQSLMKKVGATRIASSEPAVEKTGRSLPCNAEIVVWSSGFLDSGDDRAFHYAYRPGIFDLEVSSLENVDVAATLEVYDKESKHAHRIYKKQLEGSWWVTRSYWQ
jgi:hypothetical protein